MSHIFFSAGTQAPFPRLCSYVADWVSRNPGYTCFFQVGPGGLVPDGFDGAQSLSSADFSSQLKISDVVVSHAGMGNIISCVEIGVPIVVMPRLSVYGEHVNDHQVDSLAEFSDFPGVFVCRDGEDFAACIEFATSYGRVQVAIDQGRRDALICAISEFLSKNE